MIIKTTPHPQAGYKCTVTLDRSGLGVVAYGSTRKQAIDKALSGWLKCTPIVNIVGV